MRRLLSSSSRRSGSSEQRKALVARRMPSIEQSQSPYVRTTRKGSSQSGDLVSFCSWKRSLSAASGRQSTRMGSLPCIRNVPRALSFLSRTPCTNTSFNWVNRQGQRLMNSSSAMYQEVEGGDNDSTSSPSRDQSKASPAIVKEIHRLKQLRNVGILAHVDAGKTTVTERMLALAGVVRSAGSVDDGNTVTDYLPAERERGITIQSAAIQFDWHWNNNNSRSENTIDTDDQNNNNNKVRIQLIDTPGHVDFSVEVNRSVAVLDGAVLVVDAVAGVQAQTETVWRAITRQSTMLMSRSGDRDSSTPHQYHQQEPLPCLAVVNKMDKDGCHFGKAIQSIREKLPGANPIPIQMPLFRSTTTATTTPNSDCSDGTQYQDNILPSDVSAADVMATGEFAGVVDLIQMKAILWPDMTRGGGVNNVEDCVPAVFHLMTMSSSSNTNEDNTATDLQPPRATHPECSVTHEALAARANLVEALAEVDPITEECYLNDEQPSNAELRAAVRRASLSRKAIPVMASAALQGKGVEPILDNIAELLPSPLDRMPPPLNDITNATSSGGETAPVLTQKQAAKKVTLGHPLHPHTVALAFKVLHMKGRGGSGEGRIVFARVYSGKLRDRQLIKVITPPAPGETPDAPREERIGGMLELAGGRFDNVEGGECGSGDVCALVGLKTVVTGDTILLPNQHEGKVKKKGTGSTRYLAGVASPRPVIKVRLEAETAAEQTRLLEVLQLMTIEDPSLVVQETESSTLLSGLGELHIEVTLDRLKREHGLHVMMGPPSVTFRETIKTELESPGGLVNYDMTMGGTRLQGSVRLILKPNNREEQPNCFVLSDPVVSINPEAREFLGLHLELTEEELLHKSDLARALIRGCQGALKRGPHKAAAMANIACSIEAVHAEGGLAALKALPGALQAAAAFAVRETLQKGKESCTVLEPTMSLELTIPNDMVGGVLSDLSGRRGIVGDVVLGDEAHSKTLVKGEVPLVEILGYANSLRSLTGGEGSFTTEYKGHSPSSILE